MELSPNWLSQLKDLVSIVGVIVGAGSLLVAAFSLRLSAQTAKNTARSSRSKFWLDLRQMFERHHDIHVAFRPGGKWSRGEIPATPEEQAAVEAYMGLFEHCEIMIEDRVIDEKTFEQIYKYKVENLVQNPWVKDEKLTQNGNGWTRFRSLAKRMSIRLPDLPRSQGVGGPR